MIKFSSENKNALTPGFVSTALEGITHRFLLVLECETRMYGEGQSPKQHAIVPPRFAIGGPRATIDPRVAKVEELMPLAQYKLQLPEGWEKVHQYIYVLQPSTDEHGWQYRSEWSNGPLTDKDEQWVRSNAPGLDVRRRLWMATVVSRDLVVTAKRRLAEAISSRVRGVIMEGSLFRQEQGALMKTWQKRHVVLTDDTIEIYNQPKDEGGKRIAELSIVDCEAKMLFGVQCPGRDFAFSIRKNPKNTLVSLFDAETREVRRRWVVAVRYQLALLSPEVNFPPFDYGPPTGDEAATRVLMCGELQKQGHMVRNWKHRFFQLMPYEIQYFERETLKGNFMIAGAVLTTDEKSLDFSLRSPTGKILVMRADNPNNKATWVRALARQIAILDEKKDENDADPAAAAALATPTTPATPSTAAAAPAAAAAAVEAAPPVTKEQAAEVEAAAAAAEKAEEEAADKEWETQGGARLSTSTPAAPAAAAAEDVVVVVTAALDSTNLAQDDVPPPPPPAAPVVAAVAEEEVNKNNAVTSEERDGKNAAPAENNVSEDAYYAYVDGHRLHQAAEVSDYEQQLREQHSQPQPESAPVSAAATETQEANEEEEAAGDDSRVRTDSATSEGAAAAERTESAEEGDEEQEEAEAGGSSGGGSGNSTPFGSRVSRAKTTGGGDPNTSPREVRPSEMGDGSPMQPSQRLEKLKEKSFKRQSMVTGEILKWETKFDENGGQVRIPVPKKK